MKKIIEYFTKYPIWADVLIIAVVIGGYLSLQKLNSNFFPEIVDRMIAIQVIYPGASPEELEEGVVLKIEDALKGLQGVEEVTSTSQENTGRINVEAKLNYNPDYLLTEVKNAIDKINSFPAGAEKPIVFKGRVLENVITMLLTGSNDLLKLKQKAQIIENELLASGKVSQVTISGLPEVEIAVEISEENLKRYNLTFDKISSAIKTENIDISGGLLKNEDEEIIIRTRNKKYSDEYIRNIRVLADGKGSYVKLGDIARVKFQFSEAPNITLLNSKQAVTIKIDKTNTEDLLGIAEFMRAYVEKYNQTNQEGLKLVISKDRSTIIRQRIDLLVNNGIVGLFLVLIVLGFFLNLRIAFWVGVSIPISFMGMFMVADAADITINVLSLFGMILVIGILVDDGIVFSENVFSHYERGESAYNAAIKGSLEVLPSVVASVSTTIMMFIPFFFLEGRFGEAVKEMALVVIASLSFSLLEGMFVLPAHLAHSKALTKQKLTKFRIKINSLIDILRFRYYQKALQFSIKHKYSVFASAIGFLLIVKGMTSGGFIKTTFFPFVDSDNIEIYLQLKPGTREEKTLAVLQMIEQKVWEVNQELSKERTDGNQVVLNSLIEIGTKGGPEIGTIDVELLDGETRNLESFKISNLVKKKVGEIPEAEIFTLGARQIFGKPVVISVTGRDLAVLEKAKSALKDELKSLPSLKDIADSDRPGKREINLKLKEKAFFLGLSTFEISRQIRQAFFGEESQRLQIGEDEVKVWVRYPKEDRKSIYQLEQMKVSFNGNFYPLTELVDFELSRGIVNINHINGAREVKVEADLVDQNEPVPPIIAKLKADVASKIEADFPGVRLKFEGQNKENEKFGRSAAKAFPLALGGLIIILTLVFRSFYQVWLIVILIPFGIAGAYFGHFIHDKPISVLSFYGIIALTGIIVNDSVVFLDRFNENIRSGLKPVEAALNAGISRFRAILLTSLTTVAGLYPLILEKSRQAQFLIPMAISVSWGLIFATLFTLFLFPALILIFNQIRKMIVSFWEQKSFEAIEVEPAYIEQNRLLKDQFESAHDITDQTERVD